MSFQHGLKIGQRLNTYQIQNIFKHNRYKGMRYSLATNTLVLISNHYKSPYNDRWQDGILYYNGMGLVGNQDVNFMQNKTLAESNQNNVEVYLFEIYDDDKNKYIFSGQVELVGHPYEEKQFDPEGNLRNVIIFPLKPIDSDNNSLLLPYHLVEQANTSPAKKKYTNKLSTEDLKARANAVEGSVGSRETIFMSYERNIYIIEYTKKRANGSCELCGCKAPFMTRDGEFYLEIHHIDSLSSGAQDSINNTVALCPNCHRKIHFLKDKNDIQKLRSVVK